jgi:hypothetical protein
VFIFFSMSCAILAWNGIDLLIEDVLYDRYKIRYGHQIVTGLGFNVFSFVALVAIKTSRSLLILGAEIDGAMTGGAGVQFETAYFDCGCNCPPPSREESKDRDASRQCASDSSTVTKSADCEARDQASSAPRAPERSSKAAKK